MQARRLRYFPDGRSNEGEYMDSPLRDVELSDGLSLAVCCLCSPADLAELELVEVVEEAFFAE